MIALISVALRHGWSEDTAQPGMWTPSNPAKGQCAVSSLVVQELLGGDLLRGVTNKGTVHYWNRVEQTWIDTTRSQFDDDEHVTEFIVRDPDYLLGHKDTKQRYNILRVRVFKLFQRAQGTL